MPSYINRLFFGNGNGNGGYGCEPCCNKSEEPCQSSLNFFSKLSEKMLTMVKSLKKQFEECRAQITSKAKGFLLAEVEVKTTPLSVKYEYIEYIKQYGPPENGIFDETKLQKLRDELGISNQVSL
jgi:hypothetical protein